LIREGAEDEAPVRLEVVVVKKLLATFEREVCTVDEVFMKFVALLVDVIDLISVFSIDHKEYVREGVGSVGVIGDRERVELRLRGDRRQRLRACLRKNGRGKDTD
jgi:hypothetical protein